MHIFYLLYFLNHRNIKLKRRKDYFIKMFYLLNVNYLLPLIKINIYINLYLLYHLTNKIILL